MKRKYEFMKDDGERTRKRKPPSSTSMLSTVPYKRQAMGMAFQRLNPTISRPYGSVLELKSFDQPLYQYNGTVNSANLTLANANSVVPFGSECGSAGGNAATAFGGFTCINEVLQGATFYQRIGTRLTVTSINVDGVLVLIPPSSGVCSVTVRVALIYDRQPNSGWPLFSTIFAVNSNPPFFSSSVNIQNRSRFMVIRDDYIDLDDSQAMTREVHMYSKCRLDCEYGADSGTIGDLTTGAIYLMIIASYNQGTPGGLGFVDGVTRIRYYD